ncbi:putative toxin-antitoxin system toxin component, PIN family [Thiothrix subterranea]|uniref:Toxin-antitoxin system toxin component, PIN family n=1 Tax=Thiothrix subterranea TaxID=2735563 RepID=A0AA51R5Y3_9GAMM|nr:putative toxin-antitoxin system toxin component, PIN family [Thiothrix subterranea]MDQ5770004.1 putative toxin-antitoxin system toxin component, PIN family [Thiothrix subterranea]WML88295.1 putative toxin-antitoxin system toxin component, PIN family [Thiothrix subterranea]
MKLVIDTNVIIAGFRSKHGASFQLLQRILEGSLPFLLSVPLVLEYEDVLKRPDTLAATSLTLDEVDTVLNVLCLRGNEILIHYLWRPQLTDAKDDMVLELAVNGMAEAIVTFNVKDFQPAASHWNVATITPGECLRNLKQREV